MGFLKSIYNPKELSNKNGRIYYFDNLKFVLIFLVVFAHFIAELIPDNQLVKSVWLFIYSFHMPLFIFISGYFAKSAIKRKDKSRIINFLLLCLILKIVLVIVARLAYGKNTSLDIFKVNSIPWYLFAMGIWHTICILTDKMNKKYLLILSFVLSIIIGYDKNIGDWLAISRIVTFFPYFLLGTMIAKTDLEKIINNKKIKVVSFILFIVLIYIFIVFINNIYCIRPILTGRNSYFDLKDYLVEYGGLIRIIWYIGASLLGIIIMNLVPKGKTCISSLGSRTLAVYFLHAIIIKIFDIEGIHLRVYQYFIISIVATIGFSIKFIANPFNKFMNIDYFNTENKLNGKKIIKISIELIVITTLIIGGLYLHNNMDIIKYKTTISNQDYIAHALGGINESNYTNSAEAINNSYAKGFRFFEVDLKLTSDGKLVCNHGWAEEDYVERLGLEYDEKSPVMTFDKFMNSKIKSNYTPISFKYIVEYMKQHNDIYIMLDLGSQNYDNTKKIYQMIVKECSSDNSILQRFITGGYNTKMIKAVKDTYNFKLINLYYRIPEKREDKLNTDEKFIQYCKDNNISSISMSKDTYTEKIAKLMKDNDIIVYVFTVNDEKEANIILENVDMVGTDFIKIKD